MAIVKTRILIISDTHAAPLSHEGYQSTPKAPFRSPLPAADVLIHCGDMTKTGSMEDYHKTLDMLKQIDAPVKLVIAGNHDLSLDRGWVLNHCGGSMNQKQPPMSFQQAEQRHQEARNLWTGEYGRAKQEGVTFLDEGVHHIRLNNGAELNVYATPYTPEFFDWGFAYEHDDDRFNEPQHSLPDARNIAENPIPSRSDQSMDIVVTHGPAYQQLDQTARGPCVGCPHLLKALSRARPKVHCFGHIHEAWGSNLITWNEKTEDSFAKGNWQDGLHTEKLVSIENLDREAASCEHSVYMDLSSTSTKPLRDGEQTFVVNAAIMNLRYKPLNAPWLIDLDLDAYKKFQL